MDFKIEKGQEIELRAVAGEMLPLMQREAFWESGESGSFKGKQKETAGTAYEDVIMSLGSSLDTACRRVTIRRNYYLKAICWKH